MRNSTGRREGCGETHPSVTVEFARAGRAALAELERSSPPSAAGAGPNHLRLVHPPTGVPPKGCLKAWPLPLGSVGEACPRSALADDVAGRGHGLLLWSLPRAVATVRVSSLRRSVIPAHGCGRIPRSQRFTSCRHRRRSHSQEVLLTSVFGRLTHCASVKARGSPRGKGRA